MWDVECIEAILGGVDIEEAEEDMEERMELGIYRSKYLDIDIQCVTRERERRCCFTLFRGFIRVYIRLCTG